MRTAPNRRVMSSIICIQQAFDHFNSDNWPVSWNLRKSVAVNNAFRIARPNKRCPQKLRDQKANGHIPRCGDLPRRQQNILVNIKRRSHAHQTPVFAMLTQGSAGSSALPFCSSSNEIPSGERMKAMWPSRGGRLIMMPCAMSFAQYSCILSTS
jgi:hypothetical protein